MKIHKTHYKFGNKNKVIFRLTIRSVWRPSRMCDRSQSTIKEVIGYHMHTYQVWMGSVQYYRNQMGKDQSEVTIDLDVHSPKVNEFKEFSHTTDVPSFIHISLCNSRYLANKIQGRNNPLVHRQTHTNQFYYISPILHGGIIIENKSWIL